MIELLQEVEPLLKAESRLLELPTNRSVVFVGDTHGDCDATKQILARFPPPSHTLVFLGDTVDRGPDSTANLRLILSEKIAHPTSIFLLMGNHEGWAVARFTPADFWDALLPEEADAVAQVLSHLPLAAWHPHGVLALHGAFPNLPSRDHFDSIELGSEAWRAITWGDWETAQGASPPETGWGRPRFGRDEFERRRRRLGVQVLVRSHQPFAPVFLFDDRCLTIFTSSAYGGTHRHVAVLYPERRHVETARDLDLIEI